MTGTIIGIDPGVTGAIAFLYPDGTSEIVDMPVFKMESGHEYNRLEVATMLSAAHPDLIWIERPQAMGGAKAKNPTGARQNFMMGCSREMLECVCALMRLPYKFVVPVVWKRHYGLLKQTKDASRAAALRLFPELADELAHKKDHNRAEALLIAAYGREQA